MNPEIPYMLALKFTKPAEAVSLVHSLETLDLICLGEERVDEDYSIVHYHFRNDASKKIVLHVIIDENSSEVINISIYHGVALESIKELFSFFKRFDPAKVLLIDQQIKNGFYLRDMHTFSSTAEATEIPEEWVNNTEKQALLSLNFDDFYGNPSGIISRDHLLGKL